MFYYLIQPIMTYNLILIAAAIIPAVFLMIKVYKSDRLEKESGSTLVSLVIAGVLSSLLALIEERILSTVLNACVEQNTVIYNILLYFVIVAVSEESSKYIFLKKRTWKSPEFNCQFDGVVYAIFVSLGFALWENISYVLSFGFATALVRAVTAIPGHACFGVFMGVFYALAKKYHNQHKYTASRAMRILALILPALMHGAYDYIASMEQANSGWYFAVFVAIMFIVSYIMVDKMSKQDKYIK